jgi:hypothetical protein
MAVRGSTAARDRRRRSERARAKPLLVANAKAHAQAVVGGEQAGLLLGLATTPPHASEAPNTLRALAAPRQGKPPPIHFQKALDLDSSSSAPPVVRSTATQPAALQHYRPGNTFSVNRVSPTPLTPIPVNKHEGPLRAAPPHGSTPPVRPRAGLAVQPQSHTHTTTVDPTRNDPPHHAFTLRPSTGTHPTSRLRVTQPRPTKTGRGCNPPRPPRMQNLAPGVLIGGAEWNWFSAPAHSDPADRDKAEPQPRLASPHPQKKSQNPPLPSFPACHAGATRGRSSLSVFAPPGLGARGARPAHQSRGDLPGTEAVIADGRAGRFKEFVGLIKAVGSELNTARHGCCSICSLAASAGRRFAPQRSQARRGTFLNHGALELGVLLRRVQGLARPKYRQSLVAN